MLEWLNYANGSKSQKNSANKPGRGFFCPQKFFSGKATVRESAAPQFCGFLVEKSAFYFFLEKKLSRISELTLETFFSLESAEKNFRLKNVHRCFPFL